MNKISLINQSWEWAQKPQNVLQLIEAAGRTCYKSEVKITAESAESFVRMILKNRHHSVVEHVSASVKIISNRGVTHELVRHRLASYSQESTRYVNYGGKMEFILPVWLDMTKDETGNYGYEAWAFVQALNNCADTYRDLLNIGWRPEQAREVLPNALKTEIIMTANLREWRHVFSERCSKRAHPQMRALMLSMLAGFKEAIPVVFEDLYPGGEDA
jgi:thymidylate synthase (FAD)